MRNCNRQCIFKHDSDRIILKKQYIFPMPSCVINSLCTKKPVSFTITVNVVKHDRNCVSCSDSFDPLVSLAILFKLCQCVSVQYTQLQHVSEKHELTERNEKRIADDVCFNLWDCVIFINEL